MKITSYWQAETGYYDDRVGRYTRRRFTDVKEKTLEVKITESEYNNKLIVQFIGGPTGNESYYLDDLINLLTDANYEGSFSICAGTINRWPHCWIKVKDLKPIILALQEEFYENHRTKS